MDRKIISLFALYNKESSYNVDYNYFRMFNNKFNINFGVPDTNLETCSPNRLNVCSAITTTAANTVLENNIKYKKIYRKKCQ